MVRETGFRLRLGIDRLSEKWGGGTAPPPHFPLINRAMSYCSASCIERASIGPLVPGSGVVHTCAAECAQLATSTAVGTGLSARCWGNTHIG